MYKVLLFLAAISFTVFSSCTKSEMDDNILEMEYSTVFETTDNTLEEGTAEFTIDNQNSEVNEKDDLLLTNISVNAISYHWDFGNGDTSSEANPTYTYGTHGVYTITLTTTDKNGNTKEIGQDISVLCVFATLDHSVN